MALDHLTLTTYRDRHPAWRLLASPHAPLVASFLYRVFVAPNVRLTSEADLAEMLEDENLDFLVLKRKLGKAKWKQMENQDAGEPEVVMPDKRDIGKIRCLTKAIQDELHAINKYQQYMNQAKESEVKQHFCDLMNEEKEHVAEFTAALFAITHEPLPLEKE